MAHLWGIGEKKQEPGKCLKAGRQLSEHGNSSAALADVVQESTASIAACYGYEEVQKCRMLDQRCGM